MAPTIRTGGDPALERGADQVTARVQRLEIVASLAETLAASAHVEDVYSAAMEGFARIFGLSRIAILVLDASGVARFTRWQGLSDAYRHAVEGHSFWRADDTDPQPVVVSDVAHDARLATVRAVAAAEGIAALVAIPLVVTGAVLGTCMVHFDAAHVPDDRDLQCATTVARHVSMAVARIRSDTELRRTNTLMHSVLEGTSNAVSIQDLRGRYVLFNRAAEEWTGVKAACALGRDDRELFQAVSEATTSHDREVIETLQRVTRTVDTSGPDGSRRVLRVTKGPVFDEQGALSGVFAAAVDLTAERDAEETVRRQEAWFRALVEHSSDFVTVIAPDRRVLYRSPATQRLNGQDVGDTLSPDASSRVHPDDRERVQMAIAAMFHNGAGRSSMIEFRMRGPDGTYATMESTGTNMVENPDVGGLVLNSRDITERTRLQERLRHAQRLEAIGRVASGVAHDFNNILMVISGNSDFVLQSPHLEQEVREALEEIVAASDRAAELTRQLLSFGTRSRGDAQPDDVRVVAVGLLGMLRRLVGTHITLDVTTGDDPCVVGIDRSALEQVILNLVLNARDAMPDGGVISIDVQCDPSIPVVTLVVRDNGCGMDEATASQMFEPFFTTKELGQGTGLGLATVQRIVVQSGGDITVDSGSGRGTTISIVLPGIHVPAPPATFRDASPVLRGTETVLLVEDDDMVRTIVLRGLVACGYLVLEAASGAEALRRFEHSDDLIDLLLTEVVMPGGINGRVLAERLGRARPSMKKIYLSGYADGPGVRDLVWEEGSFLQKPFRVDALTALVREALDR